MSLRESRIITDVVRKAYNWLIAESSDTFFEWVIARNPLTPHRNGRARFGLGQYDCKRGKCQSDYFKC